MAESNQQRSLGSFFGMEATSPTAEVLGEMPTNINDFKKTGTLYKKRGGFLRNIPQQNWVPRTFALTHKGTLLYYEAPTITEASMAPGGGLSMPRQYLDLTKPNTSWDAPDGMTDGNTKFMLIITHGDRNVDNGQRLKLCANTASERQGWVDVINLFCKKEVLSVRTLSLMSDGNTDGGHLSDDGMLPQRRRGRSKENKTSRPQRSATFSAGMTSSDGSGGAVTNDFPSRKRNNKLRKHVGFAVNSNGVSGGVGVGGSTIELSASGSFLEISLLFIVFNLCCCYLFFHRGDFASCLPVIALANAAVCSALLRQGQAFRHNLKHRQSLSMSGSSSGLVGGEDGGLGGSEVAVGGGVRATKIVDPGLTIKRVAKPANQSPGEGEGTAPPTETAKVEMPSFSPGDKGSFQLRTLGYKSHGKKAESDAPLYELIALDVFKTQARVDEIHRNINLDKFDLPDTGHPDVPSLFLMNVQFPREQAKVFGGDSDGATCSVVFYFRITEHTMAELKGPLSSRRNALKLLAEWCKLAPDDINFRGRFKAMGFIDRIEDYGIPAVCTRFNGKPVLIKKTGTLIRGNKFIEMDINVHKFAYTSRAGLYSMKDKFCQMVIRCGFCIEGRDDDELPEVLLGCANINGVNLDLAVDL